MTELAQLKWACRRGMKELDMLLEHYLEHDYLHSSQEEQAHFQQLLTLSNWELYHLLFHPSPAKDKNMHAVISKILMHQKIV